MNLKFLKESGYTFALVSSMIWTIRRDISLMKESLKKLFIIPLAASFLVGCGVDQPTSSSSAQDSASTSQIASSEAGNASSEHSEAPSSEQGEVASSEKEDASSSEEASSQEPQIVHVESVTLNKSSLEMHIGDEETLAATISPETADDKSLVWASSNEEIATVSEGRVVALKAGLVTISATANDGGKKAECAVTVLEDTFGFSILTSSGSVTSLTRDINYDLAQSDSIQLNVTKNGEDWFDGEVVTKIEGDEGVIMTLAEQADVDHSYTVLFGGNSGTAKVTFQLKGHEDAGALTVTYNVTQYFLNQTIRRANVTEADGKISFDGTGQHTAVVKKSDTNWVLKATLDITKYDGDNSIGLGGFTDNGDHALWIGLANNDRAADEKEGILIRDFYAGWDHRKDIPMPEAYQNIAFNENEAKTAITVDCELIRNGLEYYYNIGGYHGKYTSDFAGASYAGFYSQEKEASITNYSIAYGEEAALAAIGTNYDENAKLDAGCFVNPNLNEMVRGETRQFNASVAPAYSAESYVLEADEAYAEHVTIDGLKLLIKDSAPKGTMTLTLKSASGKALDKIALPIEEVSSEKSNDQLTVKGGVILNDDGSIVFPESKIGINGVDAEDKYCGSVEYGATLKEKVLGGDFSIEFDVSDYKTTATYPKLMVSVGGDKSQFYLSYGYGGGTSSRIETNTYSSQNYGNQWNNTEDFANFDRGATHHFKIESKNGYYNFYVDGGAALAQKMDNDARNIIVPMGTYYNEMPVRLSTNGVSAKVSNIKVTSGKLEDLPDIHSYSNRASQVGDSSIRATFPKANNDAWSTRYKVEEGMFSSKLFASLTGKYKVSFDATFSKAMNDGKLAICFDDHEFHLCNSTGWGSKVENYPGHWGGPSVGNIALPDPLSIRVTIENDGNGTVKVSVPLKDGSIGSVTDSGVSPTAGIHFFTFNDTDADIDATVTISNIVRE